MTTRLRLIILSETTGQKGLKQSNVYKTWQIRRSVSALVSKTQNAIPAEVTASRSRRVSSRSVAGDLPTLQAFRGATIARVRRSFIRNYTINNSLYVFWIKIFHYTINRTTWNIFIQNTYKLLLYFKCFVYSFIVSSHMPTSPHHTPVTTWAMYAI